VQVSKALGESMKATFSVIQNKLAEFLEGEEDNYFSSDINSLYSLMVNSYPKIPDVKYVLEELQSYSNKLSVASTEDEKNKYYQLSIERLRVLKTKAEQAGVL
jgi:hypothetical protein